MKSIFLGVCAILSPLFYDYYKRNEKIKRKVVLENIRRKYQLIDENTDISLISEDYPVVIYKKIKCGDILDYDLGLKFSGVLAIKRKIEIVEQDNLSRNSIQPTKFRSLSNIELTEFTNGKFKNAEYNFINKHAHIEKIKLKDYFFTKFQKDICQVMNSSINLIVNPKTKGGEIILQNENDPHNKYLTNKFIDCYTRGNNVFIQAHKNKISKDDLKINYLAYKPTNFLLIGCLEKSIKLLEKNISTKTDDKNPNHENDSGNLIVNEKKEYELVLSPAIRYFANDYIVIPYKIQDESKAKEEIDRLLSEEITNLDLKPYQKKIRKIFYLGGAILIGYGYIKHKLQSSFAWKIKDILVEIFKIMRV